MLFKTGVKRAKLLASFAAMAFCAITADNLSAEETITIEQLPAACKAAAADFRPIDRDDVEQAKAKLLAALRRLDRRLDLDGPNGDAWREYLLWEDLQKELRGSEPDDALLKKAHARYAAGYDGLDLVWFLDVQSALHNYVAMRLAVGNPGVRDGYEAVIGRLAANMERYVAQPTTDDALSISESIRWLEGAHQCLALRGSIDRHLVKPNLFVDISADVAAAGLAENVEDSMPIHDCILGVDIHGMANTAGRTRAELWPDRKFAVIDALFFGVTDSDNVGGKGPVAIYSRSTTDLAARKRIWIDVDGLSSYPAVSRADTAIEIDDICSRRGRRIIERIAWRKAGKQQWIAEQIASRHAEERLNERIDAQAAEAIERANRQYNEKYLRPFSERKLFPQRLDFSTTERTVSIVGLQAGGGKLAAPDEPLSPVDGADMSVRLHESMINNLAYDALAGRTVYEEKVQKLAINLFGELPEKMKGDEDGKPWAITLDPRRPISVSFADGRMSITIRGVRYYKGADAHPAMNVSAVYGIEPSPRGFKLVRQGDIEVFPPDFVPGSGQKIDARRSVIRKLLEKRFENVFEAEFAAEGFEMPGKWKSVGWMRPIQLVAENGWLVISWQKSER